MKKVMVLVLLAVGLTSQLIGAEPVARITDGTASIAAGATNSFKDVWLNTGTDSATITGTGGSTLTGAGIVRALVYSPSSTVTNWSFTFYAYDGGVKKSLYAASSTTAVPSAGRFDLTNTVYSGRIRVEYILKYATNSTSTATWAAIVE